MPVYSSWLGRCICLLHLYTVCFECIFVCFELVPCAHTSLSNRMDAADVKIRYKELLETAGNSQEPDHAIIQDVVKMLQPSPPCTIVSTLSETLRYSHCITSCLIMLLASSIQYEGTISQRALHPKSKIETNLSLQRPYVASCCWTSTMPALQLQIYCMNHKALFRIRCYSA